MIVQRAQKWSRNVINTTQRNQQYYDVTLRFLDHAIFSKLHYLLMSFSRVTVHTVTNSVRGNLSEYPYIVLIGNCSYVGELVPVGIKQLTSPSSRLTNTIQCIYYVCTKLKVWDTERYREKSQTTHKPTILRASTCMKEL